MQLAPLKPEASSERQSPTIVIKGIESDLFNVLTSFLIDLKIIIGLRGPLRNHLKRLVVDD